MRVFFAAILATLFVAFGLRAESPGPIDAREHHVLSTLELITLNEGRALDTADPAGLPVELLFVPTRMVQDGDHVVLRDEITGIACAPQKAELKRIGQPGDDYLVVRGVMGRPDEGRGREIAGCRVVGWDGVVWEETRAIEADKQRVLYEAGRL